VQVHLVVVADELEDGDVEAAGERHAVLRHANGVVLDVRTAGRTDGVVVVAFVSRKKRKNRTATGRASAFETRKTEEENLKRVGGFKRSSVTPSEYCVVISCLAEPKLDGR